MIVASPADIAYDELVSALSPLPIEVDHVRHESQLRELWQIDTLAYGDHSLAYEPFLEWWQRYHSGSQCLLLDGKIIASVGIYPLSSQQAVSFSTGQISEGELHPVALNDCEEGIANWYFSGLVIVPEFQNRGLVRRLIRMGVGEWMRSGHLRYPLSLYGLGQTEKGQKAMELCGLQRLVLGALLLDGLALYYCNPKNAAELRSHFQGW